tara:strand:- start:146 stop:1117 length:972 start_codon:yes stop_codon:yes gene_type:complete
MGFLSKLTKSIFGNSGGLSSNNTGLLQYPLDLTSTAKQQVVMLTAYTKEGEKVTPQTIYLPCPTGIGFNDSAAFGTIDLGIIGSTVLDAVQVAQNTEGGAGDKVKAGLGNVADTAGSMSMGQAAKIGMSMTPFAEQANLSSRSLSNPNTNSNFTGNSVRQFSFAFKMIANSESEAEAIRQIHQRFRHYTYAKSQSGENRFTLDYPPVWTIKFLDFETGKENKYIPAIYSSYLTTVGTTFNSGANMFYNDGAPLEVDMSITYQETRVLQRDDLIDMESGQMSEREIGGDGNPKIASYTAEAGAGRQKIKSKASDLKGAVSKLLK